MGAKKETENKSIWFSSFLKSIWLFPALLTILLILLTVFKISGSSIGEYYPYFYGEAKDPALVLNRPRSIRSDEWLTNTQMDLAQKNDGYSKINPNVGNGEDTSIILDVASKDWSAIFKPHNLAFFILPFDYAFALRWWLMAFLLIISCYFFILFLMPKRRLLAAVLSLGLFFSPFIQWWYQYITLAPIYYSLFLALAFMHLLRLKGRNKSLLLGSLIAYLLVCFALVQYPPFQIACALAVIAFLVGYVIEQRTSLTRREVLIKGGILVCAGVIAGTVVFGFIKNNQAGFDATRNTVYPGHRDIVSGGFDANRLFSSNLAFEFQFTRKAIDYYFPLRGQANQSEASNFIYLMPFLVLPEIFLLAKNYRAKKAIDWPLLTTVLLFFVLMVRLFSTRFSGLFSLLGLSTVPQNRLVIGVGLLGVINMIILIRHLTKDKKPAFSKLYVSLYCLAVFAFEVLLGMHIKKLSPGFISTPFVILLALPLPIVVYLLLNKRFVSAASILLAFSVVSTMGINPLYRGTAVLTDTPLSKAVQHISKTDNGRWVTEDTLLENFAIANGARSLSGVYTYPQLNIWRSLDPTGVQSDIYNRFAHIDFKIDRNPSINVPTSLKLRGGDSILVTTEPCSSFLKSQDVHFLLTYRQFNGQDACANLIDTVKYPANTFFIYRLD